MINFTILLTEKCDFNCDYCIFPNKETKTTTLEILKKHDYIFDFINNLKKYKEYEITLAGGDIGLIDRKILDYIFNRINEKVIISCQNVFLDKNYHIKYKDKIKDIYYHISDLKEVKKLDIDFPDNVILGIVDPDISKIDKFLKLNKHLNLKYIDIDWPVYKDISVEKIKELMKDLVKVLKENNKLELIEKIQKKIDLPDSYILEKRNNCYKNFDLNVDLVNETIFKCFRDYNDFIKLSKNNFKDIFLKSPFKYTKMCDSCSRLFLHQVGMDTLQRLKIRKDFER